MTTIDRMNDLAIESTNSIIDTVVLAQKQGVTIAQSMLSVVEQNHEANHNLATTIARQTQEAQNLWMQLARESMRNATSVFAQVSEAQVNRVNETVNAVNNTSPASEKRAAAPAK
ncbi:MAG: hypothetical protein ACR2JC_06800 [Chloroflexota bacterium]|nr:MAG: hypothetical protein DLM70_10285 [Chloroflexota bacterium]